MFYIYLIVIKSHEKNKIHSELILLFLYELPVKQKPDYT